VWHQFPRTIPSSCFLRRRRSFFFPGENFCVSLARTTLLFWSFRTPPHCVYLAPLINSKGWLVEDIFPFFVERDITLSKHREILCKILPLFTNLRPPPMPLLLFPFSRKGRRLPLFPNPHGVLSQRQHRVRFFEGPALLFFPLFSRPSPYFSSLSQNPKLLPYHFSPTLSMALSSR